MGKDTAISWTDHTFSPWWGCEKISPACKLCYADTWSKRVGYTGQPRPSGRAVLPVLWGPGSERRMFGEKHWAEPLKWNRDAQIAGKPALVFSASMGDVAEARPELVAPRARLVDLVERTPWLTWQLLTKRPENIGVLFSRWVAQGWPPNVWMGVTAEDQAHADLRVPVLLQCGARTLFVSHEPALEVVRWKPWWLGQGYGAIAGQCVTIDGDSWHGDNTASCTACGHGMPRLSWIIVGGESGGGARDFDIACARSTIQAGRQTGTAVFVKQLGVRPIERRFHKAGPAGQPLGHQGSIDVERIKVTDKHGANRDEWPHDLDVREFPRAWQLVGHPRPATRSYVGGQ